MFEMQGVGKVFVQGHVLKRKSRVVNKINLMVKPGETLGLIGPSGAGKSTIGKLAVGLLAPSEGRLLFQGKDISHPNYQLSRWLKKKMQIIFQDPQSSLHPGMKIGKLLKEPLRLHRLVSRSGEAGAVKAQLARVGLDEDILDRYPAEVSGGEKQRIAIARVMALNPSFVVLDEPTSMLDVSAQANILHLLMALQRDQGMAYLYIWKMPKNHHKPKNVKVFATRMPVRPNPIGLSTVELVNFSTEDGTLTVKGLDAIDGTPILDIKPYVPHFDAYADASVPHWLEEHLKEHHHGHGHGHGHGE